MGHNLKDYERAFQTARNETGTRFELTGDTCIVGVLSHDELTPKTSIIIASDKHKQVNGLEAKRPVLVRVLEVGPGFYNDDGTDEPAGVDVGDILLVGSNSVIEISQYGKLQNYGKGVTLGLVNASQRLIRWKGGEGFEAYFSSLLSEVERG